MSITCRGPHARSPPPQPPAPPSCSQHMVAIMCHTLQLGCCARVLASVLLYIARLAHVLACVRCVRSGTAMSQRKKLMHNCQQPHDPAAIPAAAKSEEGCLYCLFVLQLCCDVLRGGGAEQLMLSSAKNSPPLPDVMLCCLLPDELHAPYAVQVSACSLQEQGRKRPFGRDNDKTTPV